MPGQCGHKRAQRCGPSGAWRALGMREVDRCEDVRVERNGERARTRYRRHGGERGRHRHAGAARAARRTLAGMMVRRGPVIVLHAPSRMRVMRGRGEGMVVAQPCGGRRRAARDRCGSEALNRQPQQRHPDQQDSKDGSHAAILTIGEILGNADRQSSCCVAESCNPAIFAYGRFVPMRFRVRLMMLWILIATLPMRGIAGAAMSSCAMPGCDHAGMAMPAARSAHAYAPARAGAGAALLRATCAEDSHQDHAPCRACAACQCAACHLGASAPPPLALAAAPAGHVDNPVISPVSSRTEGIPSRIDRPPRP